MTIIDNATNATDNGRATLTTGKGRPIIYTPERLDQIRNLVERGHRREEIAEIIGCTVGSLTVTCSRAGISLRPPRNGTSMTLPKRPPPVKPIEPGPPRDPKDALEPPGGWPPGHPWGSNGNGDSAKGKPLTFTLRISYGTRVYDVPLAIDGSMLGALACAADINGMKLSEMIARALVAGVREVTS